MNLRHVFVQLLLMFPSGGGNTRIVQAIKTRFGVKSFSVKKGVSVL